MYAEHALKGLFGSCTASASSTVTMSDTVTCGGFQPPLSTPQLNQSSWPLGPAVPVTVSAEQKQKQKEGVNA